MKMLEDRANGEGLLCLSDEELRSVRRNSSISDVYDVEDTVFARGKFATVRRANHKTTGVQYAAKYIKKRRRAVDMTPEIYHEISVLQKCAPSNRVVRLHEVYETNSDVVLVLELAAGGELQRIFDTDHCLNEIEARRAMRQILEGLCYLHEKNIAHLDLKPQNLLLTVEDCCDDIKLCDFGVSRLLAPGTEVRALLGTPDYVAPEVLSYEPISLATDIWSVGVLAYVLLSGYTPFGADTKQQTYLNISQCLLTFEADHFGDVSGAAIDFIKCSLLVNPRLRPTVQDLLQHPWISPKNHILPPLPLKTPDPISTTPKTTPISQHPESPENSTPLSLESDTEEYKCSYLPKVIERKKSIRTEQLEEEEDENEDINSCAHNPETSRNKNYKAITKPVNNSSNNDTDSDKYSIFAQPSIIKSPEFEDVEEFSCPISKLEENIDVVNNDPKNVTNSIVNDMINHIFNSAINDNDNDEILNKIPTEVNNNLEITNSDISSELNDEGNDAAIKSYDNSPVLQELLLSEGIVEIEIFSYKDLLEHNSEMSVVTDAIINSIENHIDCCLEKDLLESEDIVENVVDEKQTEIPDEIFSNEIPVIDYNNIDKVEIDIMPNNSQQDSISENNCETSNEEISKNITDIADVTDETYFKKPLVEEYMDESATLDSEESPKVLNSNCEGSFEECFEEVVEPINGNDKLKVSNQSAENEIVDTNSEITIENSEDCLNENNILKFDCQSVSEKHFDHVKITSTEEDKVQVEDVTKSDSDDTLTDISQLQTEELVDEVILNHIKELGDENVDELFENIFKSQEGNLDEMVEQIDLEDAILSTTSKDRVDIVKTLSSTKECVTSKESLVDLGYVEGSLGTDEDEERFLEDSLLWEHNQRSRSFETALQKFKSIEEKETSKSVSHQQNRNRKKNMYRTFTNSTYYNNSIDSNDDNISTSAKSQASSSNSTTDIETSDLDLSPDNQAIALSFADPQYSEDNLKS